MADKVHHAETNKLIVYKSLENLPEPSSVLVGVYGTLKKGYHRHESLGVGRQYVGSAPVPGLMFHLLDYPMICRIPEYLKWREDSSVSVEIYRISTPQLLVLDQIEGHPDLFKREEVPVSIFSEKVWVYYGHPAEMFVGKKRLIPGNYWKGATTSYIEADFADGTKKPHLIAGSRTQHIYASDIDRRSNEARVAGVVVNATTGEITDIDTEILPANPSNNYSGYTSIHRDYKTKTWDSNKFDYVNEKGEVLKFCHAINDFAIEGSQKTQEQVWQEKQKKLEPSVINVAKGEPLDGDPFPKVANL